MKKILILGFLFSCIGKVFAQGPTISLVGSSPTFSKGSIDAEILAQVIQQKQQEVKQHVFKNLIIKEFNNHSYLDHLKNYTTYSFIYHLMDVITSGKNKTVITKSIIQNATEFAYVYGMVMYVQSKYPAGKTLSSRNNQFTLNTRVTEAAKVQPASANAGGSQSTLAIPPEVKDFNFLIDFCYDIITNDASLHPQFDFAVDKDDPTFKTWYASDNVYQLEYQKADAAGKLNFDNERATITGLIKQFLTNIDNANQLLGTLKTLVNSTDHNLATEVTTLLGSYGDLTSADLDLKMQGLIAAYGASLTAATQQKITNAVNTIKTDYDQYKPLYDFFAQLRKTEFKDFTLTQDQFTGFAKITKDFLKLARHQFKNDVVGSVLDFLIENTLIEYHNGTTDASIPGNTASIKDKGYAYIDIEALVSSLYDHFVPSDKKAIYFSVFLTLGTNQASFLKTNSLALDANNNPKSLGNLYYASEKIGIKYKFWNWAYTHSFQPGENFNYYNRPGTFPRSWLRPQQQPTISDFYIMFYGSGLLYNLVNLKSDDKFNYAIAGGGVGITFFNGLSVNVGLACPYTDKRFKGENTFVNFGIDIPIIDYLGALAKK